MRRLFDQITKHFSDGGRLSKLGPLWEAIDTFAFTPGRVTSGLVHVRDGVDLKRAMITVVIALMPAIFFAIWHTGHQAALAVAAGAGSLPGWRTALFSAMGFETTNAAFVPCFIHGLIYYIPVLVVTFAVGGFWEVLFACVRKHEVNEGFFVTAFLFPMILPATIPLWQVALGISFGVVLGKEVFGGVGMNVFNPALVGRVFLFFAYPAEISGDAVWIPAIMNPADGLTGATWLAGADEKGIEFLAGKSWLDAFLGTIPGSFGETSTLACLAGAALLIATGIASWRIMAGCVLGLAVMSLVFNALASGTNPSMAMPAHWHLVLGGFAFGTVFMATDPVSAPFTQTGRWVYGFGIGALAVMVRVLNPAYPEGMMLAILFMNMFSHLIDHVIVRSLIKRRSRPHES